MKKRIFAIFLIVLTLSMNIISYGAVEDLGKQESPPSIDMMKAWIYQGYGMNMDEYHLFGYGLPVWSARKSVTWLYYIPKDSVLVPYQFVNDGNGELLSIRYKSAHYEDSVLVYDEMYYFRFCNDDGGSLGKYSCNYITYNVQEGYWGTNSEELVFHDFRIPYASSVENALLYYENGCDLSYLGNGEQFIDIDSPYNVRAYLASEENALYLYYENKSLASFSDLSTYMYVTYKYVNMDGDAEDIDIYSERYDYKTRNQVKIPLQTIMNYENGYVLIGLVNSKLLNGVYVNCREYIAIEYSLNSNYYDLYIVDYENGEMLQSVQYPITDYSEYNSGFTGGTKPNSSIVGSVDGNYDILSYLFNGFGLIGDNGALKMIGDTFSFIPQPIIVLLIAFVSIAIIIALFKLVIH